MKHFLKTLKFDKLLIVAIILMNILFADRVMDIMEAGASEPSSLVMAWFAFTTGELWCMASIKKKKISNDSKGDYSQDEEEVDP